MSGNGLTTYSARERFLEAWWAEQYGPWNEQGTWPPHPKPPCYYCWKRQVYGDAEPDPICLTRATTFIDRHEGRYTVCEAHWLQGMREIGYGEEEIRSILIEQAGWSAEQADAALLEEPLR